MRNDQKPNAKPEGIPTREVKESKPAKNFGESKKVVPKKLSPEEQMAAFEEDLKESDWGHQPC